MTGVAPRPNLADDKRLNSPNRRHSCLIIALCTPYHSPTSFTRTAKRRRAGFDTVYMGAPPGTPIRGVQTWDVPAGGGMCFELDCDIPGEFPFVNHGFGHGQKGAIGFLVVEP